MTEFETPVRSNRAETSLNLGGIVDRASRGTPLPPIVSLFSGAGGLDHGFKDEGFDIAIAFDRSAAAIETHKRNFPKSAGVAQDLTALGPLGVLRYALGAIPPGSPIGIIGGPPCQGFSRANVKRNQSDPRNRLPALYLKIIGELKQTYDVQFVVFENVLGMRDRKHKRTYDALVAGLAKLGFHVSEEELCALDFGVPQTRKRIVLTAVRRKDEIPNLRPRRCRGQVSVREAIGGLQEPLFFSRNIQPDAIPLHANHWTMNPRSERFKHGTIKSGGRCFKKLDWDKPSPTIAFGHREIYVHPSGKRRLSIYEAMLLQGFPKSFVLAGNLSEQVEQISNAVPPPLAKSVASAVRRYLDKLP